MLKNILNFLYLGLLISLTDCRCQNRQVVIKNVFLEIPTYVPGFKQKEDRERFSDAMRYVIDQNEYFHFDAKNDLGHFMRLALLSSPTGFSDSILLVASLTKNGEEKKQLSFAAIKVINLGINKADVTASVNVALRDLYEQKKLVADKEKFYTPILKKIAGENISSDDLLHSLSVLSDSNDKKTINLVMNLLKITEDGSVASASIMVLGELKAEEAMETIIDFVERKPSYFRLQAINAAKNIASKLAAEWLLVMAYGYNDPLVQKEAFLALESIEKKAESSFQ